MVCGRVWGTASGASRYSPGRNARVFMQLRALREALSQWAAPLSALFLDELFFFRGRILDFPFVQFGAGVRRVAGFREFP